VESNKDKIKIKRSKPRHASAINQHAGPIDFITTRQKRIAEKEYLEDKLQEALDEIELDKQMEEDDGDISDTIVE